MAAKTPRYYILLDTDTNAAYSDLDVEWHSFEESFWELPAAIILNCLHIEAQLRTLRHVGEAQCLNYQIRKFSLVEDTSIDES